MTPECKLLSVSSCLGLHLAAAGGPGPWPRGWGVGGWARNMPLCSGWLWGQVPGVSDALGGDCECCLEGALRQAWAAGQEDGPARRPPARA